MWLYSEARRFCQDLVDFLPPPPPTFPFLSFVFQRAGWKSFFKSTVARLSSVDSGFCHPTPPNRGTVVAEVPEFTQIDLIQVTCASISQSFWSWEWIGCSYWSDLSTWPPPDWGGHVHPMLDQMTLRWSFSQRKSCKLNLRMETELVGRG